MMMKYLLILIALLLLSSSAYAQIHVHNDTIPDFAKTPTVTSVTNGPWSNAATWSPARVPAAGDVVRIGNSVSYDVNSTARITTVQVALGGALTFRTDVSTKLTVANLQVLAGGSLTVGTAAAPVAANVTATIAISDTPLDTTTDPEQYGNGLIVMGTVTMHGAPLNSTFVRLMAAPQAGANTLSLASPVTGWKVGDQLFVPDSRQLVGTQITNYTPNWEFATISAISSSSLTLSAPLAFTHPGSKVFSGDTQFLPHVANLSRNVIVRSENVQGVHGHSFFTGRAVVDIRYTWFLGLGRTTKAPLDSTTFDSAGNVTHIGTNEKGRYPTHFHHLVGPTSPLPNGRQFNFIGNSVFCSITPSPFIWGVTVHQSHYGLLQDNVVVNWAAAGFVTEHGSESGNVIARNFVGLTNGTGERVDNDGRAGSGFWFHGPNNYVRDNVATTMRGGIYTYGFAEFSYYTGSLAIPVSQGADPEEPGGGIVTDMNATAIPEFARNEVYGATDDGLTLWWIGTWYNTPRESVGESVIKDFRAWNLNRLYYFGYETNHVTLDGFVARGQFDVDSTGLVDGGDYFTKNHIVRKADIRGTQIGIGVSVNQGNMPVYQDCFLDNKTNIDFPTLVTSGGGGAGIPPKAAELRNVVFGSEASGARDINMSFKGPGSGGTKNWIQSDKLFVYGYDGTAGDDFEVYYLEQAPTFIVPQSTYISPGVLGNVGSPVAGETNQQNWTARQIAIAGSVAPCSDQTSHPRILGFTCAMAAVGTPTPAVTPGGPTVTPTTKPTPAPSPTAIPGGWSDVDIGGPAFTGSYSVNGGTVTIKGGGADIWGTSDQFNYAFRQITGDAEIIARIVSLTTADQWGKAGLMVRGNLDPSSRNAFIAMTPGHGVTFQYRPSDGAATTNQPGSAAGFPRWLRIVRKADQMLGYESPDGATWTLVSQQTIFMPDPVLIGFAVTSHDDKLLATASLDGVSQPGGSPTPTPVVTAVPPLPTPTRTPTPVPPTATPASPTKTPTTVPTAPPTTATPVTLQPGTYYLPNGSKVTVP